MSRGRWRGPVPGMVLIHHMPGWDEWYRECTRRFAHHGYATISHNLYSASARARPTTSPPRRAPKAASPTTRWSATPRARCSSCARQPWHNGKVGLFGTCSGGRQTFLFACKQKSIDCAIELWGGRVVQDELTPKQPVSPITLTAGLSCPLLGLFGNEDRAPTPEQVDQHEAELKKQGKNYEFHRYDGAGHGFFYYDRPAYRIEQALDGWQKVLAFCEKHLSK